MSRVETLRAHLRDPLYRNGYALMANTAITSFLGLIYGILAAHIYSTSEFGRAYAQIAAVMLISALTQMNFTSVLLRFLPRAGTQTRRVVMSCYAIAVTFAAVVSTIVVVVVNLTTSKHFALHMSAGLSVWFVLATCAWSVFNLQDGAMTGLRRTIWVPVENGSFNIAKIALLFALKPLLGSNGIFVSTTLPVMLTLIPINLVMFKRFIPRHTRETRDREQKLEVRQIGKYIAGDYVSTLFGQAMTTFMPVLVAAVLGSVANGYFSIAQTMGMALDLIAFNLAQSLTVEASGNEEKIRQYTISVAKRILTLVLPLAVFLFIAAPLLLRLFGPQYPDHATWLLRLLIISSLAKAIISVHIAMARLYRKTIRNAVTAAGQAVMLIGGSVLLMRSIGINGVGWAAIFSQTVIALLVLPWMVVLLQHDGRHYRRSTRSS